VTTEFENAPAEALDALSRATIVRPSGNAVAVAQDRIARTITPEDQLRLVDRYSAQLQEAR